jgi:hypothetical protein
MIIFIFNYVQKEKYQVFKRLVTYYGPSLFHSFSQLTPCPSLFKRGVNNKSGNELSPLSEREGTKG